MCPYCSDRTSFDTWIVFTTSLSWISKVIRWFTNSKFSHVFFVYYDTDFNRSMMLEATEGGFRIRKYNSYGTILTFTVKPKHDINEGIFKAIDWLGSGYDYLGLFGMAWVELGRWLGRKWRNPLRDSNTMFCSEAVARALVEAKYPGTENWDVHSIDPEMLFEFFQAEASLGAKQEGSTE